MLLILSDRFVDAVHLPRDDIISCHYKPLKGVKQSRITLILLFPKDPVITNDRSVI